MGVTFFTCATRSYEHFAPVYIASITAHVRDAFVEIGVEDVSRFQHDHGASLALLPHDRFLIREVVWDMPSGRRAAPNSVRFINEPLTRNQYVYIGDIDVVFLDPQFAQHHLEHMSQTGLPYSNAVREGTQRLTGLHFSRWDAMYPLPDVSGLGSDGRLDEVLLYEIVQAKGHAFPSEWFRPVHGLHISPNRPEDPVLWGVRKWASRFLAWTESPSFTALYPTLAARMQRQLRLAILEARGPQ
jgi:hypothetical protein